MIAQTSLEAFYKIRGNGRLSESQKRVFEVLKRMPIPKTAAELAVYCQLPINCVMPRLLELRTMGLVVRGKRRVCDETGEYAYEHFVSKEGRENELFKEEEGED